MTRRDVLFYVVILVMMGAGWGATQPMTKTAVSTGLGHFGLVFWQLVIGSLVMGIICLIRRTKVPLNPGALRLYLIIAMIGTVIPNTLSFQAAVHLPAGIMSLLISAVPMFAFVIALALGNDSFDWRRLAGLVLGLVGVLLIVAPSVDLGPTISVFWASIYLLTAMCYGFEGNYVAKWGTMGLGAFQVMMGASLVGALISGPLMWVTGQSFMLTLSADRAQGALMLGSVIHVLVYASYVWLVTRAGAIFAAQVSYLVTGFGLLWAWLLLGETYDQTLWLALAVIFAGLFLVQPGPRKALAAPLQTDQG